MGSALKAALVSGLVFPGLGHMLLKRYRRGITLILAFSACLAVVVVEATKRAVAIIDRIQYEGGVVDMATVSEAARQASTGPGSRMADVALLLLVAGWIFGIVDAYRIGRRMDAEGSRAAS